MIRKLLVLLICSFGSYASAVEVIVQDIPGVHNADGSGQYDKLILKVPGTKLSMEGVKRAYLKFEECPNCCVSPANQNPEFYAYTGDKYIASKPMNIAKVYIFSRPDQPAVADLAALKGKTVGARLGLPYGKKAENAGIKYDYVGTDLQNIKLLKASRIDFMIAYVPDAYDAFKEAGFPPFPHVKDQPIAIHEDSVLCKNTPENKAFIEKMNASLK